MYVGMRKLPTNIFFVQDGGAIMLVSYPCRVLILYENISPGAYIMIIIVTTRGLSNTINASHITAS